MNDVVLVDVRAEGNAYVADFATNLADLLRGRVRVLGADVADRRSFERILAAVEEPEAAVLVVGCSDRVASLAWSLAQQCDKPVVLVPETEAEPAREVMTVLVPLDGTSEAANALIATMRLFNGAAVEIVVLHVFDKKTAPRFWDQGPHAESAWEEEFRTRFCDDFDARVILRSGRADESVLEAAAEVRAGLVVLGWAQTRRYGHARTLQRVVATSTVPLMLVPIGRGGQDLRT